MRVLHLTPELPFEGGGGGRGREYFFCRRLVDRGHQVLNLSPVAPNEAHHVAALPEAGVENWVAQRPESHLVETVRAVSQAPRLLATAVTAPVRALEMGVFWTELRPLAERAVREWRPDVAVVVHDMAAAWASALPESIPAVLTLHDLTWHQYLSRAQRRGPVAAQPLRVEAARYRRHVLGRLPRFSAAICVSTSEAAELRAISRIPVSVISIGVVTMALTPAPEQDGPPRLVFTGTLGYQPNSQGIRWFADRVWPEVLRRVPDARLDIVGRGARAEVTALGRRPGITVVGEVPAIGPYFDRAHAVVVPILSGAGVRVKIVEAMAAGRAIVSTSLGWEGLPHVEPGRHLLVADEPVEFAEAAVRLISEPDTRRRIANDARRLAEKRYDWRSLGDEQLEILRNVLVHAEVRPAG